MAKPCSRLCPLEVRACGSVMSWNCRAVRKALSAVCAAEQDQKDGHGAGLPPVQGSQGFATGAGQPRVCHMRSKSGGAAKPYAFRVAEIRANTLYILADWLRILANLLHAYDI